MHVCMHGLQMPWSSVGITSTSEHSGEKGKASMRKPAQARHPSCCLFLFLLCVEMMPMIVNAPAWTAYHA